MVSNQPRLGREPPQARAGGAEREEQEGQEEGKAVQLREEDQADGGSDPVLHLEKHATSSPSR